MSMLIKSGATVLAVFLIILGVILTPMPIPLGIICIILGVSLLVSVNKRTRIWLTKMRRKYSGFSDSLVSARPYLPGFARRVVDSTDPKRRRRQTVTTKL